MILHIVRAPATGPAALQTEEQHINQPETTGETENGRSISVISRLLPTNSNLAIAQAAHTPNTRFRGTAIPAASNVNRIAASASGFAEAGQVGAHALGKSLEEKPPPAAGTETIPGTGSDANQRSSAPGRIPVAAAATPPSTEGACRIQCSGAAIRSTNPPECNPGVRLSSGINVRGRSLRGVPTPFLQQVDRQQQGEREHQHDHGNRGRAGVVELVQLGDNQQRRDFGSHRHVARDENHRAVFAHRAGKGHGKAGQRRGQNRGQDHPGESLPAAGAQTGGGFFESPCPDRPAPAGRVRTTNGRPIKVSAITTPSGE